MVTVFTTSQCAYCVMVKKFLTVKGVDFTVVNLDDDSRARQELIDKTGALTVPVTMRGDDFVVGWNPAKLSALI